MQFWTLFSTYSWHSLLALLGLLFGLLSALSLVTWSASRLWKVKPAVTMNGYVFWRTLQGITAWSRKVTIAFFFMVLGIAADHFFIWRQAEHQRQQDRAQWLELRRQYDQENAAWLARQPKTEKEIKQ